MQAFFSGSHSSPCCPVRGKRGHSSLKLDKNKAYRECRLQKPAIEGVLSQFKSLGQAWVFEDGCAAKERDGILNMESPTVT